MTGILRRRRGTGSHRADDRIAELKAAYEQQLAELREENVAMHNRLAGADDFFMIQDQYLTNLEADVRQLTAQVAEEQGAHAATLAELETRDRWIGDLQRQVAEVKRRLEIRVLAENVIGQTQEIPVEEIRRHCAPVPLHQSPMPRRDPAHVPAWAHRDGPEPAA
ncbi:hypothetical protein SGFS_013580 [Streptomyces graminofaciens]|uniref:Uncharacterized protein n=1 Tax=Streptomyces graminofaciens TaxID=68212 RepID=A0ABN5V9X9_9ACTN|nr:hypothetical protein [Streptomyces graminofaciens]BBC30064.1 hypothetical protein SGFS_013580 [Streptomyces graminofaciens]